MKINVTKEHISKGNRRHGLLCPITLALKNLGYKRAATGYNFVILDTYGSKSIPLPQKACKFVKDFDTGQKVEPFAFNLEWK